MGLDDACSQHGGDDPDIAVAQICLSFADILVGLHVDADRLQQDLGMLIEAAGSSATSAVSRDLQVLDRMTQYLDALAILARNLATTVPQVSVPVSDFTRDCELGSLLTAILERPVRDIAELEDRGEVSFF